MPDLSRYAPDPALGRRIRRTSFIGFLVALLLAAWGIHTRVAAHEALARLAATADVIDVTVVKPVHGHTGEDIVLPGTVAAYTQAAVFARTSGYLRAWYADIGTRVHRGQRLATIATLFFVPTVFSLVHRHRGVHHAPALPGDDAPGQTEAQPAHA